MTLRQMWNVLTGHPERAADGDGRADDPKIVALDWFTTDSSTDLSERAARAARETSPAD